MHDQKLVSSRYTIKNSSLVLLTLATAFFPRVAVAIGFPSIINFLHFAFIAILCVVAIPTTRNKAGARISKSILFGLLILLIDILVSAILNYAGVINVILDFLLLSEPFLLMLGIISIRMSQTSIRNFRIWLMLFASIHLGFAYYQKYVMGLGANPDDIKGIFIAQGAGHHVGGAISLTAATYFFIVFKTIPVWLRALAAAAFAYEVVICDAKQVWIVFLVALLVLLFTKLGSIKEALRYLLLTLIAFVSVFYAAQFFLPEAFNYWFNPHLLINSITEKYSVFSLISSYYRSFLNSLFGLGPGHTIGRLAELIPTYKRYLEPLGVTSSTVTQAIFLENDTNPLTNAITGSSMFSLTFSWAGIWGDLGFLGLGAYLYLWLVFWHQLCSDNLSRFFVFTILSFGAIFSWLEEPAYMLFVVSLIGVQWQEIRIKQKSNLSQAFVKRHVLEPQNPYLNPEIHQ